MVPFFLFHYIMGKLGVVKKTHPKNIPYEELWSSVIRCKLVYKHPEKIQNMWSVINNIEDRHELHVSYINDAYIRELRDVSEPVHFHTQNNITLYLWHTPDTIYMTFHIEKHIEKQFLNKQSKLVPISGCITVNRFFYSEILSILKPIIGYIEGLKRPVPRRIIIAGYSVGGVISQILSVILGQLYSYKGFSICCHTFGSPKAGNSAFVKWFNNHVKEHYRVVNENDPITMLPLDCNWCHAYRTTLQFDHDVHMNVRDKKSPWYKRLFSTKFFTVRKMMKQYEHDHDFDIYTSRLWKYARVAKYIDTSDVIAESP